MGKIEARLAELGLVIPTPAVPVANYVSFMKTGSLVMTAGQLPTRDGKLEYAGKIGKDLTAEDGTQAARLCGINIIAQLKAATGGDLDRIVRLIKLVGFVNATDDFSGHPQVINGASDLMVEVFGEIGKHARSAVGVASLPLRASVEIEAIAEIS